MSNKRVYKGLIQEKDWGEADDVLFVDDSETPFLEELQGDRDGFGEYATVIYYISDTPKNKDELEENLIKVISGDVEADFGSHYSEYTGYLWTDEELKVGGHDLVEELRNNIGKYLYLEVEWRKADDQPY